MRVLITGAAGFLGSHLMLRHLMLGDEVLGVDNYCSSSPRSLHVKRIQALCKSTGRGLLFNADISKENSDHYSNNTVDAALDNFYTLGYGDNDLDLIYNFACPASPPVYQRMPIDTLMTCTFGVKNILHLARQHKAKVVHASTSEIYGDPEVTPQSESYRGSVNTWGPRSNYDEGKRCAEALCYEFLQRGTDVRVVRIFNTYGPHLDPGDGRVISNFIVRAGNNESISIYGDGEQTRSFCYVTDLIAAIVKMGEIENPLTPINIGNPVEFTMLDLADKIGKMFPNAPKPQFNELPVDDPTRRCPNIGMAKTMLNWEPKITLNEGLYKLASDWFEQGIITERPVEL
jgi:UDP-glucuronate decarboxylase